MKLQIMRMSGQPVSPEHVEQYKAEFQTGYDAIVAEHGQDMLTVHQKLKELDEELMKKWDRILLEKLPTSAKKWAALIKQFDAPIMLALSLEPGSEGKLVLVVMDEQLG